MLLVKYGEIALKSSSVRRRFEQQFIHNIEKALMERKLEASVELIGGVVLIRTSKNEEVEDILAHTFGVIYYSRVVETSSAQEEIEEASAKLTSSFLPNTSFAVRCKRTGDHPYTSMGLAARLGEVVLEAYPEKKFNVNLTKPKNTLMVEVRQNKCHLYIERKKGPGGMPVGTQGRALLLVTKGEEEEAAVAGWLVLKRGVRLFIYQEEGAEDVVSKLLPWHGPSRAVEAADVEEALYRARCIALVSSESSPQEKPVLHPPLAMLYPVAGLPQEMYAHVSELIGSD